MSSQAPTLHGERYMGVSEDEEFSMGFGFRAWG